MTEWQEFAKLKDERYLPVSYYNEANKKMLLMGDGRWKKSSKNGIELPEGGPPISLENIAMYACLISARDHFFITGGGTNSDSVDRYWANGIFDKKKPSFKQARRQHACASYEDQDGDTMMIVAGGVIGSSREGSSTVEILWPDAEAWSPGPKLPKELLGPKAVNMAGNIFLAGGYVWEESGPKHAFTITLISSDQILRLSKDGQSWVEEAQMGENGDLNAMTVVDTDTLCG